MKIKLALALSLLLFLGCSRPKNPHHLVKVGSSRYVNPAYYANELAYKEIKSDWKKSPKIKGYKIELEEDTYISYEKPEINSDVWKFTTIKGVKIESNEKGVCTEIELMQWGETEEQYTSRRRPEVQREKLQFVIDTYGDGSDEVD